METPRDVSFCAHTILANDTMVVEDALADSRLRTIRWLPLIRKFALCGAKLTTSDGYALGSLCVIDRVPRKLTSAQKEALQALSRQVVAQMEYKRTSWRWRRSSPIGNKRRNEAANQAAEAASRAKSDSWPISVTNSVLL